MQLVVVDGEALFFSVRNDHFFPSLRVLHKCAPRRGGAGGELARQVGLTLPLPQTQT